MGRATSKTDKKKLSPQAVIPVVGRAHMDVDRDAAVVVIMTATIFSIVYISNVSQWFTSNKLWY